MKVTRGVSGSAAFEDDECREYYWLLKNVKRHASVLEIGLQFGRSSSIVMQMEKEIDFLYIGIDPFTDPPEAREEWINLRGRLGSLAQLYECRTIDLMMRPNRWRAVDVTPISLALIDGDHSKCGVMVDCIYAAPRMAPEGYLLFHDYGRESTPEVQEAADATLGPTWERIKVVNTLAVFKLREPHRGVTETRPDKTSSTRARSFSK